jgi:hypothetical protein
MSHWFGRATVTESITARQPCSRRPEGSQPNCVGRRASQSYEKAQTRERGGCTDRDGAGRGEVSFAVAETRIGEKPKFKLSDARLLTILGGGVDDDLAKLVEGSIYRK